MFRTALRNVLAHKARLLMTVLAVMLGVAFVSGTLVFADTLSNAFRNQSAKSYDDVAVSVTSHADPDNPKEEPGLSGKTLDRITAVDGVAGAYGRVEGFAGVADPDGKLIGVGWSNKGSNFAPGKDGKDSAYTFTDGSGPVKDDQIALDKESATKGEYQVGDRVRVATNGPVKEYTLSGVFTTEDGAVNAAWAARPLRHRGRPEAVPQAGLLRERHRHRRPRRRRREDPGRGQAAAARHRRGPDRQGARGRAGRADRAGHGQPQAGPARVRSTSRCSSVSS